MVTLDLTRGVVTTEQYKAFKFPGGEIHFKLSQNLCSEAFNVVQINTRLNTAEDLIFLCIVVDTLKKDFNSSIEVFIPYMPYQQADRNFSKGECFSLKTITRILNSLPVDSYEVFDPHSDITAALINQCQVVNNHKFISCVLGTIYGTAGENVRVGPHGVYDMKADEQLVLLCPDSGAYKKIFNLAEALGFEGEILCCQKHRSITTGAVQVVVPTLPAKDVLIIDDICVGGRTFIEIAKRINLPTGCKKYLAISHGIFSSGFSELSEHFDGIFTTNSRKDSYEDAPGLLKTYKII